MAEVGREPALRYPPSRQRARGCQCFHVTPSQKGVQSHLPCSIMFSAAALSMREAARMLKAISMRAPSSDSPAGTESRRDGEDGGSG